MALLSREEFVNICTQAILTTRKKITINNQKSGYLKYHLEIKENNYFAGNVRAPLRHTKDDEYIYRHDLIEHVGLVRGDAIPEREVVDKHPEIYDDYTLEESIEDEKFDPSGQIHYFQQASNWQFN